MSKGHGWDHLPTLDTLAYITLSICSCLDTALFFTCVAATARSNELDTTTIKDCSANHVSVRVGGVGCLERQLERCGATCVCVQLRLSWPS
jgi:hypothetical protein